MASRIKARDTRALHLKLDEVLHGVRGARTGLVNLEQLSDEERDRLQKEVERLNRRAAGSSSRSGRLPD